MQNTSEAGSPFVVTNSSAELKAPDGLTFIPSDFSSNTVVEMGNIAPEEVKEAKWVLRGDKKGSYNIRAEFNGILQPCGENINAVYTTKDPVKVWVKMLMLCMSKRRIVLLKGAYLYGES
jgi:hypothetical protein